MINNNIYCMDKQGEKNKIRRKVAQKINVLRRDKIKETGMSNSLPGKKIPKYRNSVEVKMSVTTCFITI